MASVLRTEDTLLRLLTEQLRRILCPQGLFKTSHSMARFIVSLGRNDKRLSMGQEKEFGLFLLAVVGRLDKY
ncbi:uncharacterized protein BO96DRAFT_436927 [Aspergillus niger CBS 101883]|uniref:Uncharacterized protein n=2 Tax=Aspergillus niger TaxID=5061 RepID=A2QYH3_ASPNC|nr:uncharacterized protein BO96DRAFT_436927 [Aspergillus niger CBS 101883]XP_059601790.1 hypothetical protein An12g01230 [Aspergillus niger]PYH53637.1 hypothetical protein BO96DRAFT_436927 [Aspergillus niger CBS 101883]CAK41053.1 hypothetical protein An12g01230 [Aspergillus niger]